MSGAAIITGSRPYGFTEQVMNDANSTSLAPIQERASVSAQPMATIRAYRRAGVAVVTVERQGRPSRRHHVSLQRYDALRERLAFGRHPWKTSGAYMRSSLTVSIWATMNGGDAHIQG
jgi:hypothetical protein